MKLPEEILGQNKVRDAAIIKLYSEGYSCSEIKELRKLNLSVRRIEQIVYKNRAFVKINREFEEVQQINRIKRHLRKAGESKKDALDWESLLDGKITPKKVEHSGEVKHNLFIEKAIEKLDDIPLRIKERLSIATSN